MKFNFRDFFYLDENIVEGFLGHIDGFIADELSTTESTGGTRGANAGGSWLGGNINTESSNTISRTGKYTPEVKYNELNKHLVNNNLEQISSINEHIWSSVFIEDNIIECKATVIIPKAIEMFNQMEFFKELGPSFGINTNELEQTISQVETLEKMFASSGIPIVLELDDGKYKLIAYLDKQFIKRGVLEFDGIEVKILCKILEIIPYESEHKIYNLNFIEKNFVNREQRRKNKGELPKMFKETLKGPACNVLPIAIFR